MDCSVAAVLCEVRIVQLQTEFAGFLSKLVKREASCCTYCESSEVHKDEV